MLTPPTSSESEENKRSPSSGSPDHLSQLEELLEQAEQASTIALRMLAIARATAFISRWNQKQAQGQETTPPDQRREPDASYRIMVTQRLLESAARALAGLAQGVEAGLRPEELAEAEKARTAPEAENQANSRTSEGSQTGSGRKGGQEEGPERAGETGSNLPPRLTPTRYHPIMRETWTKALQPQTIKGRKNKPLRGGGTVAGNQRAVEFINLLRRAEGLTRDQLRFLAGFSRPQSTAAQHETSETVRLLETAGFVTAYECATWKNSQAQLYALTAAGHSFYNIMHLPELGTFEPGHTYPLTTSLQRLYGINQALASFAGTCQAASSEGRAEQIMVQSGFRPAWYAGPNRKGQDPTRTVWLEWEENNYSLAYRGNTRYVSPDALGRVVVDDRRLAQALLQQASLDPARPETKFNYSRFEGVAVWPFALEYDWARQGMERFAQKVTIYTELYNINRYWPEKWLGRFPVILVVTAGDYYHMLDLMSGIYNQLRRLGRPRYPQEWWFTTTGWFATAYSNFIGTFNNRRRVRPIPALVPGQEKLYPAEKGRIWLPLSSLEPEPPEDLMVAVKGLNYLITQESLASKKLIAADLETTGLERWLSHLVALPLPH